MPRQLWALTQSDASFLVDHSIRPAADMGVAVTVAVVEAGGGTEILRSLPKVLADRADLFE